MVLISWFHLGNENKYVLHYRNLWLYVSLGMKLIGVHRISKIKKPDWLKKYIDFNTGKGIILSIALKKAKHW